MSYRRVDNMRAALLAVSGSRKVAAVASTSRRRVRIFETDVLEEEEESFFSEKASSSALDQSLDQREASV
jgi:hypothetical protein